MSAMFLVLRVLVGLLMLQALVKFTVFFAVSYDTRRRMLDRQYGAKTTATKGSDLLLLAIVVVLVALLFASGRTEYVSFAVGLWSGMTLIQTYFHEFSKPLAANELPGAGEISPIKMMSYAIQADPARPWRQLAIIAILAIWVVYRLVAG
jgi:hypothetical protein